MNLENTRTQAHIDELVQFLGQEHPLKNVEKPLSVIELGKQTLEQQKNLSGKQLLENIEEELIEQESDLIQTEDKDK